MSTPLGFLEALFTGNNLPLLIGTVLIVTSLVGGGFSIKEITVPQMGLFARAGLFVGGVSSC